MCFAPQRRTIFRHELPKMLQEWCALHMLCWKCASRHSGVRFFLHPNFQKVVRSWCACAFWLENVLLATAACNFVFLIRPDGSAPAALASLLLDPPDPQIIGKTPCFATVLTFRTLVSSFFWLFLFLSLALPISAFHLSIIWLLNFLWWLYFMDTFWVNFQKCHIIRIYIYMSTYYIYMSTYYIYTYIHIYIYIHIDTYIYIYIYTYIYIYIHIYTYIYIYIHIYIYIYTYIHIYIYIHMYTYIHIYIYTYTYIYTYIHIHTYIHIYVYTYIHIYIHTYIYIYVCCFYHIYTYI